MAKYNKELFKIAQYELTKSGFVDAQTIAAGAGGGMPPGGDPAAMAGAGGGAPPGMDPSMMGGDPAAMAGGGDPTLAGMPPEMAQALQGGDPSMGAPPTGGGAMGESGSAGAPVPEVTPAGGGSDPSDVKNKIKEVLQETGVIKTPKMKPEEQFQYIVSVLGSVCEKLGISMPPIPDPADKPKEGGSSSSSGGAMTNGASGKPSAQSSSSGSAGGQAKTAGAKAADLISKLKRS